MVCVVYGQHGCDAAPGAKFLERGVVRPIRFPAEGNFQDVRAEVPGPRDLRAHQTGVHAAALPDDGFSATPGVGHVQNKLLPGLVQMIDHERTQTHVIGSRWRPAPVVPISTVEPVVVPQMKVGGHGSPSVDPSGEPTFSIEQPRVVVKHFRQFQLVRDNVQRGDGQGPLTRDQGSLRCAETLRTIMTEEPSSPQVLGQGHDGYGSATGLALNSGKGRHRTIVPERHHKVSVNRCKNFRMIHLIGLSSQQKVNR